MGKIVQSSEATSKYATGEWKRAHAPEWLLKWVEKYHIKQRGKHMLERIRDLSSLTK